MPETNVLNQVIDQLLGLGPEALVIVGLIVLGYLLKVTPIIPNKAIPGTLFLIAVVAYPIFIRSEAEEDVALIRSIFIAMALWLVAWLLHGLVLKRIEQKLGVFQEPPPTNPPSTP